LPGALREVGVGGLEVAGGEAVAGGEDLHDVAVSALETGPDAAVGPLVAGGRRSRCCSRVVTDCRCCMQAPLILRRAAASVC
jgi:hypothetical protein